MTKIQRLKKLCKWLIYIGYAENEAELASKLGYTKSSFSQIMNEKVPLSDKFIDKICAVDNNINKVWIKTEKGSLIKGEHEANGEVITSEDNSLQIDLLLEKIKFQSEQIEFYKKQVDYLNDQLLAKKDLNKKDIEAVFNTLNKIEEKELKKSVK